LAGCGTQQVRTAAGFATNSLGSPLDGDVSDASDYDDSMILMKVMLIIRMIIRHRCVPFGSLLIQIGTHWRVLTQFTSEAVCSELLTYPQCHYIFLIKILYKQVKAKYNYGKVFESV
jgi:hypothetical protein